MPMAKYSRKDLSALQNRLRERERRTLSPRAVPSETGRRRIYEEKLATGYRQAFAVDVDRILHSRAYTRYIDKTQVFFLIENDHITHRVLHVQLVSKIARTIGRFLMLNEDLIEAIALGHDIGHAPFGHVGESILSQICTENGIGPFRHNVQSIQFLDKVERKGKGWNLCIQTLDGILGHNGEVHEVRLNPGSGYGFAALDELLAHPTEADPPPVPGTLEGCVVRVADTIAYIGRDIEDAIRLGMITRSEIPGACVNTLGNTNGDIVYNLVTDMIVNSHDKGYVAFSPEVAQALKGLKEFNYERIYLNPSLKCHVPVLKALFRLLFERYLDDIIKKNDTSIIYSGFLDDMSPVYTDHFRTAEVVRDFIAGMTDSYFLRQCPQKMVPRM